MDFETAIGRVLSNEGGYVNNPADPGGETQWGISKRSYPDVDIKALTRDEAKGIYLHDFWTPINGADLPAALAFQVLDFAVNSACHEAVEILQRAVGVAEDGHIGPATLAAAQAMPPAVLLITYLALRLKFMTKLKNWPNAGGGWANRIGDDLLLGAQDLLT